MHRNRFALVIGIMFAFIGISHAADSYQVTFEHNVEMKTRDGVALRADIYRPKADGKFPTLLMRTPYDKNYGFSLA